MYMLLISSQEKSKGYTVYWYLKPVVCIHQSRKVHKKVFRHKAPDFTHIQHLWYEVKFQQPGSKMSQKKKQKKTLHQNLSSLYAANYLRYALYLPFFGMRCSATITFVCDMLVRPQHIVLHQLTCLAVAKQWPCKNKSVNEGSSRPLLCLKAAEWKVDYWSSTYMPITAVKPGSCTRIVMTPVLNFLHVLSLLACTEIPGRPFPLLDPLNYISLPPSCLNGETECVTNCLHWE